MFLLNTHKITLICKTPGHYESGVWVPPVEAYRRPLSCSVQPVTGKQLDQLPQGELHRVRYTVYAQPVVDYSTYPTAVYKDKEYKILFDQAWEQLSIAHNQFFLAELGDADV